MVYRYKLGSAPQAVILQEKYSSGGGHLTGRESGVISESSQTTASEKSMKKRKLPDGKKTASLLAKTGSDSCNGVAVRNYVAKKPANPRRNRSNSAIDAPTRRRPVVVVRRAFSETVERLSEPLYRGKRITVYSNGDRFQKGVLMVVNRKYFPRWESFIEHLNAREEFARPIPLNKVYSADGKEVRGISSLQHGQAYVVASNGFIPMDYGKRCWIPWKHPKRFSWTDPKSLSVSEYEAASQTQTSIEQQQQKIKPVKPVLPKLANGAVKSGPMIKTSEKASIVAPVQSKSKDDSVPKTTKLLSRRRRWKKKNSNSIFSNTKMLPEKVSSAVLQAALSQTEAKPEILPKEKALASPSPLAPDFPERTEQKQEQYHKDNKQQLELENFQEEIATEQISSAKLTYDVITTTKSDNQNSASTTTKLANQDSPMRPEAPKSGRSFRSSRRSTNAELQRGEYNPIVFYSAVKSPIGAESSINVVVQHAPPPADHMQLPRIQQSYATVT